MPFEEAPLVIRSLVKTQFSETFRFRLGPPISSQAPKSLVVLLPSITTDWTSQKRVGSVGSDPLVKDPFQATTVPFVEFRVLAPARNEGTYSTRKIVRRTAGIIVPPWS